MAILHMVSQLKGVQGREKGEIIGTTLANACSDLGRGFG